MKSSQPATVGFETGFVDALTGDHVQLSVGCPLMQTMEKSMGERRLTYHAPVGISVGEPLDIAGVMGDASALNAMTARRAHVCRHPLVDGQAYAQGCSAADHGISIAVNGVHQSMHDECADHVQVSRRRRVAAIKCSRTKHLRRSQRSTSRWLLRWRMQACERRAMGCTHSRGRRDDSAASQACIEFYAQLCMD